MPNNLLFRKTIALFALLVISAACSPLIQDPTPVLREAEISEIPNPKSPILQSALDRALLEGQGAHDLGISAAVFVPGYEPWLGVSGNSQPGVPITPDMLFNMGSIAKTFEAALVLQLAEEGALDLDQPISTWLPDYPGVDGRITPRQLLNHTSGLYNVFEHPDFPWVGPGVDYEKEWRTEEVIERFVDEPYGRPGEVQHYSSTNYLLLTKILEQTLQETTPYGPRASSPPTRQVVPQEITRRFLTPLQLENTFTSMGDLPPARYTVAHPWIDISGDGVLEDISGTPQIWIASMTHPVLYATPEDMARWMAALYGEKRVLSQDALDQMLAIPADVQPDPEGGRYGLGVVDFSEMLGVPVFGHGGSALGYSAAALYLPEEDIALAWAINTGEGPPELAAGLMQATWSALSEAVIDN